MEPLTDDKLDAPTDATTQTLITHPKNTAAHNAKTKSINNTDRQNRNHEVSNDTNQHRLEDTTRERKQCT